MTASHAGEGISHPKGETISAEEKVMSLANGINNLLLALDTIEDAPPDKKALAEKGLAHARSEVVDLLDQYGIFTD